MVYDLYSMISSWESYGFYDILLPFILVFTICYAILQKVKIFGSDNNKFNVIISLVIAFLFLQNEYLIFVMQRFLPNISIVLLVFVMFLLILGLFVGENQAVKGGAVFLAFVVSIISVMYALSSDIFYGMRGPNFLDIFSPGERFFPMLLTIGAIVLVVALVGGNKAAPGQGGKIKQLMEDFIGSN